MNSKTKSGLLDIIKDGEAYKADLQRTIETLRAEIARKDAALKAIAEYDEQPIWMDDRDDAANDMLRIARKELGLESD